MSISSNSQNTISQDQNKTGIVLVNQKFLQNLLNSTLIVFGICFILEVMVRFQIFGLSGPDLFVSSFVGIAHLIEYILKEKNLLYKMQSDYKKDLLYYIISLSFALLLSIIYFFLIFSFNISPEYKYLTSTLFNFSPLLVAYIGHKLKKI